jgi:hypothetical protein
MGVKGIEANLGKRNLSYSIVNAIGGKYLRALRRPNKGRKYNSNTPKNRNNRTKRLALLGRYCDGTRARYLLYSTNLLLARLLLAPWRPL